MGISTSPLLVALLLVPAAPEPASAPVVVGPDVTELLSQARFYAAEPETTLADYDRLAAQGAFAGPGLGVAEMLDRGRNQWAILDLRRTGESGDQVLWFRGQMQVLDLLVIRSAERESYRNGYHTPLAERAEQAFGYAFPLRLESGESVRLVVRGWFAPREPLWLTLEPRTTFQLHSKWMTLWLMLLLGMILALGIYNGLIFLWTGDAPYGAYAAYTIASVVAWAGIFSFLHLILDEPERIHHVVFWGTQMMALWNLVFAYSFLSLDKWAPRLGRIYPWVIAVTLAGMAIQPFVDQRLFKPVSATLILPTLGLVIGTAFYALAKGNRRARFLVLGWLPFMIFISLYPLQLLGILPPGLGKEWFVTFHAFEILSLSFALADRIRLNEHAREEAQQIAIEQLELRVTEAERSEKLVSERSAALDEAARQRNLANTDSLTSIGNRAAFLQQAERLGATLASSTGDEDALLAMLDVDGLKRLNDSRGHAAGDAMLVAMAEELGRNLRGDDHLYRVGGDEFVILAPCRSGIDLQKIMRERVERAVAAVQAKGFAEIDASVGFAWCSETNGAVEAALELADERMYRHKTRRRQLEGGSSAPRAG